MVPKYLPMLVPPREWNSKNLDRGCYFNLRCTFMRTQSSLHNDSLRIAKLDDVYNGLNYLGLTAWRINPSLIFTVSQVGLDSVQKRIDVTSDVLVS